MLLITKTCPCDKLIGNQFLVFVIGLFFISHEVAYNLSLDPVSSRCVCRFVTCTVDTIPRISLFASTREGTLGVGAVCIIVAVM